MEHLADDGDLVRIELRLHPKVNPVRAHAKEKLTRRRTACTPAGLNRAQAAIEKQLGGRQGHALLPAGTMNRHGRFHLANRRIRRFQCGFLTCDLVDVLPKIQRLGALLAPGVEMRLHRCLFPRSYHAPCEINPVLHRVVIHLSPPQNCQGRRVPRVIPQPTLSWYSGYKGSWGFEKYRQIRRSFEPRRMAISSFLSEGKAPKSRGGGTHIEDPS